MRRPSPHRASWTVLTSAEVCALRSLRACLGVVPAAKQLKIATETLHTAASGGGIRPDTAARIRQGLA